MNKRILVVSAGLLALVVFALGVFFYTQQQTQQAAQLAQDNRAALVRPHSPAFGNSSAKVTIVEFIDPACETCSAFYPLVKSLVGGSFGQVLARLAIVRLDRRPLGWARAIARAALICLVVPTVVIGAERRALNDLVLGTVVVRRA